MLPWLAWVLDTSSHARPPALIPWSRWRAPERFGECPLWVKSGHSTPDRPMSALRQMRSFVQRSQPLAPSNMI